MCSLCAICFASISTHTHLCVCSHKGLCVYVFWGMCLYSGCSAPHDTAPHPSAQKRSAHILEGSNGHCPPRRQRRAVQFPVLHQLSWSKHLPRVWGTQRSCTPCPPAFGGCGPKSPLHTSFFAQPSLLEHTRPEESQEPGWGPAATQRHPQVGAVSFPLLPALPPQWEGEVFTRELSRPFPIESSPK